MDKSLQKSLDLLKRKCNVIPDKYAPYRGGYLFAAYPPGTSDEDKEKTMSPFYLVDIRENAAGPFSPALDFDGFFKAAGSFKSLCD